jgi:hypothetical protein
VSVIKFNCNRSANKSNNPVQNPLLSITETRAHDNMDFFTHFKTWPYMTIKVLGLDFTKKKKINSMIKI